jgi:hypothetical protein
MSAGDSQRRASKVFGRLQAGTGNWTAIHTFMRTLAVIPLVALLVAGGGAAQQRGDMKLDQADLKGKVVVLSLGDDYRYLKPWPTGMISRRNSSMNRWFSYK